MRGAPAVRIGACRARNLRRVESLARRALILAFSHEGLIGVATLGARASPPAEPRLRAARPHRSPLP